MKKLLLALIFTLAAFQAEAATCFWVGGAGTWSTSNGVSWSSSSGGSASTCAATGGVPKQAADTATFDASSGGGTVTVDSTINGVTLTTITMGAFTGTLDFSVNNPSITLSGQFSITGSGVRALKLGSGTFTLSAAFGTVLDATTSTNLTLTPGTATILVSGLANNSRTVNLGTSLSWPTITVANTGSNSFATTLSATTATTIANLNFTAPVAISFGSSITYTITNAFTWAGTAFNNAILITASNGQSTVTISAASGSTCNWCALGTLTFSNTAVNATNSFDLKGNNMNGGSITGPSGGGGRIIGG